MASEKIEERITEALQKGTDKADDAMQDRNWKRIAERIKAMEGDTMPRRVFHWKKAVGITISAAVMALALSTFTQPGQAALEKLRQYFEPEKKVEYEVEGNREDVDSRLQQGEIGYVIYYDQNRYKVVEDGQIDRIVMKDDTVGIPEVYMEIFQNTDSTPEELAAILESGLKADFSNVDAARNVTDPLEAVYIHAINGGSNAEDPIVDYYLIDNTKGGTFIIKMKYFLEAAEGHGSRFHNMLKDFTIVESE